MIIAQSMVTTLAQTVPVAALTTVVAGWIRARWGWWCGSKSAAVGILEAALAVLDVKFAAVLPH
ncbi:hypothetical protein [Streptomyces cinereoruber]|uniref:hypothetical protein n=1 Tax=Streptomyces cinereoruber TaxID=67260 RepID=UPI003631BF55